MSRNSDRLAGPAMTAGSTVSGEVSSVGYVRATINVPLPSEGKLYPSNHPLYNQESVDIKEMTAKEEDILMTRSHVQRGVALDKLLESLLPAGVNPGALLNGDKNALYVATRIAAYGADYRVQDVTCQYCLQAVKEYAFDLSKLKMITLSDVLEKLPAGVRFENGIFYITLPKTKLEVGCKMLDGDDETRIMRTIEARKKNMLNENSLNENMRAFVVSIDGETDRARINGFLIGDGFPSADSLHLRNTYGKLVPNVEMKQNYVCSNCGYEKEIVIPMTTQFFWPNG